jgi:hypothetical protein
METLKYELGYGGIVSHPVKFLGTDGSDGSSYDMVLAFNNSVQ